MEGLEKMSADLVSKFNERIELAKEGLMSVEDMAL